MTNFVFYPVTGTGTLLSPYTWGTGQISFMTAADWAAVSTLNLGSPPSTTDTVPGSGTGDSQGAGQDSVALIAGDINSAYLAYYETHDANGTTNPYLAQSSYPVDVVLNSGSVELDNLVLAGFNVSPNTAQYPTLEVSAATLKIDGDVINNSTVTFPTITLPFVGSISSAAATGGGTVDIASGGSLDIVGTVESAIDINFADSSGNELELDQPTDSGSSFAGVISGDADGNTILLPNVSYLVDDIQTTGSYDASSHTYTISIGDPTTLTFDVAGLTDAQNLHVVQDGDGIGLVTCFAAGTMIRTASGDVAVEDLAEGDLVRLARTDAMQPIRWIGRRRVDCRRHPRPEAVWPVRIAAGAFGPAAPARDLLLSPDHAVFVDGCLVPVKYLIDGDAIRQERRDAVTYFHVELARHDVMLAEGLAVETYLDTGDRDRFDNAGGVARLGPPSSSDAELAARVWEAKGCAPLVVTGPVVAAIRRRLRAASLARKLAIGLRAAA